VHVVSVSLDKECLSGERVPFVDDVPEICTTFSTEIVETFDSIGACGFFEGIEVVRRIFGVDCDAGFDGAEEGGRLYGVKHFFHLDGIFVVHANDYFKTDAGPIEGVESAREAWGEGFYGCCGVSGQAPRGEYYNTEQCHASQDSAWSSLLNIFHAKNFSNLILSGIHAGKDVVEDLLGPYEAKCRSLESRDLDPRDDDRARTHCYQNNQEI
jgi:hypothetical protein